jgi:hypothetical protein
MIAVDQLAGDGPCFAASTHRAGGRQAEQQDLARLLRPPQHAERILGGAARELHPVFARVGRFGQPAADAADGEVAPGGQRGMDRPQLRVLDLRACGQPQELAQRHVIFSGDEGRQRVHPAERLEEPSVRLRLLRREIPAAGRRRLLPARRENAADEQDAVGLAIFNGARQELQGLVRTVDAAANQAPPHAVSHGTSSVSILCILFRGCLRAGPHAAAC